MNPNQPSTNPEQIQPQPTEQQFSEMRKEYGLKDREFNVARSDGSIEQGWTVGELDETDKAYFRAKAPGIPDAAFEGRVKITKVEAEDDGTVATKYPKLTELQSWQSPETEHAVEHEQALNTAQDIGEVSLVASVEVAPAVNEIVAIDRVEGTTETHAEALSDLIDEQPDKTVDAEEAEAPVGAETEPQATMNEVATETGLVEMTNQFRYYEEEIATITKDKTRTVSETIDDLERVMVQVRRAAEDGPWSGNKFAQSPLRRQVEELSMDLDNRMRRMRTLAERSDNENNRFRNSFNATAETTVVAAESLEAEDKRTLTSALETISAQLVAGTNASGQVDEAALTAIARSSRRLSDMIYDSQITLHDAYDMLRNVHNILQATGEELADGSRRNMRPMVEMMDQLKRAIS